MADVDMFLKIDGIKGESLDDKHKDTIQVLSYSLGVNNEGTGSSNQGSEAPAVAVVHDITVTKFVDIASPNLFISSCSGKHLLTAWLCMFAAPAGNKPAGLYRDHADGSVHLELPSPVERRQAAAGEHHVELLEDRVPVQARRRRRGARRGRSRQGYDVKANKFS